MVGFDLGRARPPLEWLDRRPLHVGAGALALGLASAEHPRLPALAGLTTALGLVAARRPRLAVAVSLGLLVGAALGVARIRELDSRMDAARPGTSIDAVATILVAPRPSRFESSAELRIETGPASG